MASSREVIENAKLLNQLTKEQEKTVESIREINKQIEKASKGTNAVSKEKVLNLKEAKKLEDEILEAQKKEIKILQGISDIHDDIKATADKEAMLAFDIAGTKKKIQKYDKEIVKLNQIGTNEAKKAAEQLRLQMIQSKGLLDSKEALIAGAQYQDQLATKLTSSIGLQAKSMGELKDQALLFTKALIKNPYVALLAAAIAVVKAFKSAVTFTFDLQKNLGTSFTQSKNITKSLADPKAIVQFKALGVNVSENIKSFQDAFGGVELATKENLITLGKMQKITGISNADAIKLSKTFMDMTGSTFETALNFQETTAALAEANGVAPGDVVKDLAENTEMFAEFAQDGGKNLATAAVQAKKLGLNLATTGKIANSLLDFESSIEKEMEASLMIGKQLNFNRARALALEGNLAGAAAEVAAQVGGPEALNKMNVLQRRALADSIGVSVDELSKLASGNLKVESDTSIEEKNLKQMGTLDKSMNVLTKAVTALTVVTGLLVAVQGARAVMGKMGGKGFGLPRFTKAGKLDKRMGLGRKLSNVKKAGSGLMSRAGGAIRGAGKSITSGAGKVLGAGKGLLAGGAKIAGKGLGKSALKKIPGIGAIAGLGFAANRLMKGDILGSIGDAASGLVSIVPGVGTALSVGIDGMLAARDMSKAAKSAVFTDENRKALSTSYDFQAAQKETDPKALKQSADDSNRLANSVLDQYSDYKRRAFQDGVITEYEEKKMEQLATHSNLLFEQSALLDKKLERLIAATQNIGKDVASQVE